jgi:CxxC motif-containing protein
MKHITCITCPVGCRITVDTVGGEYVFSGGKCPKGAQFALTELTAPMRTLTTTVRTAFPAMPVLPVRTRGEVPKGTIPEIIRELSKLVITEKTGIGGIVAADILGTGTDIIATGNMLYKENDYE